MRQFTISVLGHEVPLNPGLVTQIHTKDALAISDLLATSFSSNVMQVGHAINPVGSVDLFIATFGDLWGCDPKVVSKRKTYLCDALDIDSRQSMTRLSQDQRWIVQWIAVMVVQPKCVVMYQSVFLPEYVTEKISHVICSLRRYKINWLLVGPQHWFDCHCHFHFGVNVYDAVH